MADINSNRSKVALSPVVPQYPPRPYASTAYHMDSAPKDGSVILVLFENGNIWYPIRWYTHKQGAGFWGMTFDHTCPIPPILCWRPLPSTAVRIFPSPKDAPASIPDSVVLTVAEIRDLAESVGLLLDYDDTKALSQSELEEAYRVTACGTLRGDDGALYHYAHVSFHDDYPEEGGHGLGTPLKEVPPTP